MFFFFRSMNASYWIPWGPSRWAWEAEAGQSAILHAKTTPSIVNVTIFPCVASLIITPHSQTQKKDHIEDAGMRKMYDWLLSFCSLFPFSCQQTLSYVRNHWEQCLRLVKQHFLCVCDEKFFALILWEPSLMFVTSVVWIDVGSFSTQAGAA